GEIATRCLEGLHRFEPGMMAESPDVVLLQFEPSTQQLVAPIAEQKAQIQALAFLYPVDDIPRLSGRRLIKQIHCIEAPELRETGSPLFHLDAVEQVAPLYPNAAGHCAFPGFLLSEKIHDADVDQWPALHDCSQVQFFEVSVLLLARSRQFDC